MMNHLNIIEIPLAGLVSLIGEVTQVDNHHSLLFLLIDSLKEKERQKKLNRKQLKSNRMKNFY
jgi:hypothetical protein